MIYSEMCIDETAGFDLQPDGSMKPRKIGREVLTIEECKKILEKRRKEEQDNRAVENT